MESREQYELRELAARARGDTCALAHTLRHLAELSLGEGHLDLASREADEAIKLYRTQLAEPELGLANALRVRALVYEARDEKAQALVTWHEARSLYEALDVVDGVAECDHYLPK